MSPLWATLVLVGELSSSASLRQLNHPAPEPSCVARATARDRDCLGWAVPDFAYLQSGGYLGLATVGAGYALLDDRLNVAFGYGVSPAFYSGRTVHALHATFSYRPLEVSLPARFALVPYVGVGMLVTFGKHYFWSVPARYQPYDDRYYDATGRYWTAQLGLELDWTQRRSSAIERHGLFVEVRAIDELLLDGLRNPELIEPWEMLSSAFGYRVAF